MAVFLTRKMPKSYRILCTGDWHVGSRAFHDTAARALCERLLGERHTYAGFMGDLVEGKPVSSPHFDPATLHSKQVSAQQQIEFARGIVGESIKAKKWLWWNQGNHDRYLCRDVNLIRALLCEPLGLECGGYQTWLDLGSFRIHAFHGRRNVPRGAKDPIQRDANQRAWLVNYLSPLAGNCLVHLMGHTHHLLVQEPIEEFALLAAGDGVRGRSFVPPTQRVEVRHPATGETDVREFIPPTARWYGNTGTLRRTGGFWGPDATDYGEGAGFAPQPIGYLELVVEDGRPVDLKKVIV